MLLSDMLLPKRWDIRQISLSSTHFVEHAQLLHFIDESALGFVAVHNRKQNSEDKRLELLEKYDCKTLRLPPEGRTGLFTPDRNFQSTLDNQSLSWCCFPF